MRLRYVRSHVGSVLDERGFNFKGERIFVEAPLKNGELIPRDFFGAIDSSECFELQKVKLVGFTGYSLDDGKSWKPIRVAR
ncbi:hypothetical protein B6A42_08715 [Vibrio coralliilyticus]|nr:hypothetical protein B6A42_08715 [Vibrio coralliilyticus]